MEENDGKAEEDCVEECKLRKLRKNMEFQIELIDL